MGFEIERLGGIESEDFEARAAVVVRVWRAETEAPRRWWWKEREAVVEGGAGGGWRLERGESGHGD